MANCKITVAVRKTVQEEQYEPFSVELAYEGSCPADKKEEEFKTIFENLETTLYDILNERLEK